MTLRLRKHTLTNCWSQELHLESPSNFLRAWRFEIKDSGIVNDFLALRILLDVKFGYVLNQEVMNYII